jgi:hypothetical protein
LGPDRVRGFGLGPVRRADLLRLGLHRAIVRYRSRPLAVYLSGSAVDGRTILLIRQVPPAELVCPHFVPRTVPSFLNSHFAGRADFFARDRATIAACPVSDAWQIPT